MFPECRRFADSGADEDAEAQGAMQRLRIRMVRELEEYLSRALTGPEGGDSEIPRAGEAEASGRWPRNPEAWPC